MSLLISFVAGVVAGYLLMTVSIWVGDIIAFFWEDDTWGDFR